MARIFVPLASGRNCATATGKKRPNQKLSLLVALFLFFNLPPTILCLLDATLQGSSQNKLKLNQDHLAKLPSSQNAQAAGATTDSSEEQLSSYQQDQVGRNEQCHCPCDEAKYELIFEGLWSKHTHPDNFPESFWLAHFSDIIGASHSSDYRMWSPNSNASEGVKELAEIGSTKKLEAELKQVTSKTRTIIKARELSYPTLNSKTSAVFRTDRQHHLVSILSKLGPSPDWMVGVSGLDLCQDCAWATQRVVNLFLWDAGTDSGTTFESGKFPTIPQQPITPFRGSIKSQQNLTAMLPPLLPDVIGEEGNVQQDTNSYFSTNEEANYQRATSTLAPPLKVAGGEPLKPFARFTVTRLRIYEKSCLAESQSAAAAVGPNKQHGQVVNAPGGEPQADNESLMEFPGTAKTITSVDCRFTDWSDWTTCSSRCGRGLRSRTRAFVDEQAHMVGCPLSDLIEKEVCLAECDTATGAACVTRDWSAWSKCSVNCGRGFRKRTREPIEPTSPNCESSLELAEVEPCTGACVDEEQQQQQTAACKTSDWSNWSECSVACGRGTKLRTRQYLRKEDALGGNCTVKLFQKQPCSGRRELCKDISKGKFFLNPLAVWRRPHLHTCPSASFP